MIVKQGYTCEEEDVTAIWIMTFLLLGPLTDFIWAERRVELVGEGHRFFDLVRTKKAAQKNCGLQLEK
jgi:hypothetical protein